jgi:hypothetical protein
VVGDQLLLVDRTTSASSASAVVRWFVVRWRSPTWAVDSKVSSATSVTDH